MQRTMFTQGGKREWMKGQRLQSGVFRLTEIKRLQLVDPDPGAAFDDGETEGRQRKPEPPTPSTAPADTRERAQAPPLPDTSASTLEQMKEITIGSDTDDGTETRAMETTRTTEIPDVQQPTGTPGKQGGDMIGTSTHMNTGSVGTCTCCNKHSDNLQQCEPCGQPFHEECITYSEDQGIICNQCIEDQHMIGGQSRKTILEAKALADEHLSTSSVPMSISSNDSSEDSLSTNTGGGSSYSVATPLK